MIEGPLQPVSESSERDDDDDEERCTAADFPEPAFVFGRGRDTGEVHAVIGGEEGKGEEYDGDAGENEDGFVLRVGDDGEFVLLD